MSDSGPAAPLVFDLGLDSPFSFKCQACGACCHNKAIEVGPSETARLAGNRGLPVNEFVRLFTEEDGLTLRNRPDGSCVFLDEDRCAVHPDRPLVCRMFPIGLIRDGLGNERYGVMPLHPDCLGIVDGDITVALYLKDQGTAPYLAFIIHKLESVEEYIPSPSGWERVGVRVIPCLTPSPPSPPARGGEREKPKFMNKSG